MPNRKSYPTDVSDEEWAFVAPYLTLVRQDAPQRVHDLRAVLRLAQSRTPEPTAAVLDSRTLRSTPESGHRSGYDGAKRKKGSKVHAAVDTLGHLLALRVTPATEQDRAQVEALAESVQEATAESVQLAYVDRGYTG
jgi:transposase